MQQAVYHERKPLNQIAGATRGRVRISRADQRLGAHERPLLFPREEKREWTVEAAEEERKARNPGLAGYGRCRLFAAQDSQSGVAKDGTAQGGFLQEMFREDGGVRAAGLKSPPSKGAPFGGMTMEDAGCRLDDDLGPAAQQPQEKVRLFAGTDSPPPAEATVEVAEALEGLAADRHVRSGAAHCQADGERMRLARGVEQELRFRQVGAIEAVEGLADRVRNCLGPDAPHDGENLRVGKRGQQARDPVGIGPCIIVKKREDGPCRSADARVTRAAQASARLVHHSHLMSNTYFLEGVVRGAIVDNHHFRALGLEGLERTDTRFQGFRSADGANDNADLRQ
jgi:hypothetical protein